MTDFAQKWELYPEFQLRSAGFPAQWVLSVESNPDDTLEARKNHEVAALRRVYSERSLQQALWWQSPGVARNYLPSLLQFETPSFNSKFRRRLRTFQNYLQRYCAKNEAIGYFGPIGFGRLSDTDQAAQEATGEWLTRRETYLEPWLVEALLEHFFSSPLYSDERLCFLNPRLRIESSILYGELKSRRAGGGRSLPPDMERLLLRTATEPCSRAHLIEQGYSEESLTTALRHGWLSDSFCLPSTGRPIDSARAYAGRLREKVRAPLLAELERWDQSRIRLGLQPEEQIPQFLDTVRLSNHGQTERHQGAAYGGRQGYYEDCARRGFSLPGSWFDTIAEPISLLLESARWVSFQSGTQLARALMHAHKGLFQRHGDGYSATALWEASRVVFAEVLDLESIDRELARRWWEIIGERPSPGGHLRLDPSTLRAAVAQNFTVPSYGFRSARFHSFDIFFGPQGQAVLGEIHPCLHTFNDPATHHQHPNPERLRNWYQERTLHKELLPARQVPYTRLYQDGWSNSQAYHLLVDPAWGSWREPEYQWRLGDFQVFQSQGRVFLRHKDGYELSLLDFFESDLRHFQATCFEPFRLMPESIRLSLGELVVGRRSWTLQREQFCDLDLLKGDELLLALSQKLRSRAMPSRLFVKYPHETKPVLLQTESLVSLELFWHLFSGTDRCRCQEVLPELEEAWVGCSQGFGTAEFRFVVFDRRPYSEAHVLQNGVEI